MPEPPPPPPPRASGPVDPTVPLPVEAPPGAVVEEEVPAGPPLEPPPPPLGRQIWPWLLLLLLLVLAGLGILLFATHHGKKHASNTRQVPSVVGAPRAAATARLKRLGFVVRTQLRASVRPKDVVLSQVPQAGAKLSRGSSVALTVSSGPPKQGVPNVVGLKAAAAIERLKAAHLDSRQELVFAREAAGTVVKQAPAAGTAVKKGAPVLLSVSKGPQRVAVPAVVGRARDDAVAALKQAGLAAAVFSVPSTEQRGLVVAQDPTAGTKAPKGSRVRLNVSKGAPATTQTVTTGTTQTVTTGGATTTSAAQPASTTMPNVVGKRQTAAAKALRAKGLLVRTVYVPSTKPRGTVVAQRPAVGSTVKRGSRVRVNVSNGPNPQPLKAVPDVTGEDEATATADLQAAGFQVEVVDQPTTDQNQDGLVVDEDPTPGTRIPSGSQVTIYVGRFAG